MNSDRRYNGEFSYISWADATADFIDQESLRIRIESRGALANGIGLLYRVNNYLNKERLIKVKTKK